MWNIDAVRRVIRRLDTWDRNSVRTDVEHVIQMLSVRHHCKRIKAIIIESIKNTDPNIIQSTHQ